MNTNKSNVIFLLSDEVRAMRVRYDEEYAKNKDTVKKTFDKDLKVGDYVVVETSTRYKMTVCKIIAQDVEVDFDSNDHIGWIITKVDLEEFDQIKEQENTALAALQEAEKAKKKREMMRDLNDLKEYAGESLKIEFKTKPSE